MTDLSFHVVPTRPGLTIVARGDLYLGEVWRGRSDWGCSRGDKTAVRGTARTRGAVIEKLLALPALTVRVTVEDALRHFAEEDAARVARGEIPAVVNAARSA